MAAEVVAESCGDEFCEQDPGPEGCFDACGTIAFSSLDACFEVVPDPSICEIGAEVVFGECHPADDAAHAVGDQMNAINAVISLQVAEKVAEAVSMPGDRGEATLIAPEARVPAGSTQPGGKQSEHDPVRHEAVGQDHHIPTGLSRGAA